MVDGDGDSDTSNTATVTMSVVAVNDPPTADAITDPDTVLEGNTDTHNVAVTSINAIEAGQTVTVTATESDSSLFSITPTVSNASDGTLACPSTSCAQTYLMVLVRVMAVLHRSQCIRFSLSSYCDMTTDSGGWTLIANISDDGDDVWSEFMPASDAGLWKYRYIGHIQ